MPSFQSSGSLSNRSCFIEENVNFSSFFFHQGCFSRAYAAAFLDLGSGFSEERDI
jgi:hypothetical protein